MLTALSGALLLFPCESVVTQDIARRTTVVQVCPATFGEVYGPYTPPNWKPAPQRASTDKPMLKKKHVHKKKKKKRRHKRR